MARSKSSRKWLKEHFSDPYVTKAKKEGYRSRAVYKLLEIQEKHQFIKKGDRIIELGAAPGSWTQVLSELVGVHGKIYALDLLEFAPIHNNVEIIQGDFNDDKVYQRLLEIIGDNEISQVISDMLPNTTGVKKVDQLKSIALVESVVDFAMQVLTEGGNLLFKVLQGPGFQELVAKLRGNFVKVVTKKPEASRSRSQEVYILALGYSKEAG